MDRRMDDPAGNERPGQDHFRPARAKIERDRDADGKQHRKLELVVEGIGRLLGIFGPGAGVERDVTHGDLFVRDQRQPPPAEDEQQEYRQRTLRP